jgi:hypothetical protein
LIFIYWCSTLKIVQTHFAVRGSKKFFPQKILKAAEPHRSKPQKEPGEKYRLKPYFNFGGRKFFNHFVYLANMYFLIIALVVIVCLVVFRFIYTYYKGKTFETWYKIALICSYKKLQSNLKEEKLSKSVFNRLFLFDDEKQDIKEFTEKNHKLIEEKAAEIISQDIEFRDLIIQTLFVKLAVARGYDNRSAFDKILGNDLFKTHFLKSHIKPCNLNEYVALVESFRKKHGL